MALRFTFQFNMDSEPRKASTMSWFVLSMARKPVSSVQIVSSNSKAPCAPAASTRGQFPLEQVIKLPVRLLFPAQYAAAEYCAIRLNFCNSSLVIPSLSEFLGPTTQDPKPKVWVKECEQCRFVCKLYMPRGLIEYELGIAEDRTAVAKYRQIATAILTEILFRPISVVRRW